MIALTVVTTTLGVHVEERKDKVWQDPEIAEAFLKSRRGAIPCAAEQIKMMMRLVDAVGRPIRTFLDLGCGDGTLGAAVLEHHPEAYGVFIDFSKTMIKAAESKVGEFASQKFILADYSFPEWQSVVGDSAPFDAVISGYSIHHQPDERKREVYEEIFDLLRPGGAFVNVEHVQAGSARSNALFEDHIIDSFYALEREQGGAKTRDQIANEFRNRRDAEANILAPVDAQCQWLREIGYADVDCYFKIFELAVFGGFRP